MQLLFRVLGSSDDARDAAQDAFVQAFQKLKTFRGNSAFYSWLFRIALNAAATQRRRTRQKPTSIESMRETSGRTPVDPHPEAAPSHSMERAERQKAVQAALAALPAEFRIPLVLKEIDGLKYQEIAEIVGCPIGTVRSRIHRARIELRPTPGVAAPGRRAFGAAGVIGLRVGKGESGGIVGAFLHLVRAFGCNGDSRLMAMRALRLVYGFLLLSRYASRI